MALPTSGPLSFLSIAVEIGGTFNELSLRNMSSLAGFSTPDAVSEFYGYSGGGGGGCNIISLRYNAKSSRLACATSISTRYSDNTDLFLATMLYSDSLCSNPAVAGWYSDGTLVRFWDGTSFSGFPEVCR